MVRHPILLFAGLREAAGVDTLDIELPERATVADLLRELASTHEEIALQLAQCRVAVAQEFVGNDRVLDEGEEIALIPPVSGGHDGLQNAKVALRREPLSLDAVVAAVTYEDAGGIATFSGHVRRHSRGHTIEFLDYEGYEPMALKVMRALVDRIETSIPGSRIAVHHRLGHLLIGETAVIIAASAPHRAEAFAACRAVIEALKHEVPIWKREVSTDGAVWIGSGP